MLRDVLRLHRAEGAQPHMEGDIAQLDPHLLDLPEQFRGEVQAGGGGGGGAVDLGVDGLIPLIVLKLLLDVGRQRHLAQLLQYLQEDPLVVEAHQTVPAGCLRLHRGGEASLAEGHLGPRLQLPARADQALPESVPLVGQQQHLTGASPGEPVADQPGWQDPGVVQHQAVPRPQQLGQLIKVPVGDLPGALVQGQQSGGVPALQRGLSDQLLRKVKIKI